MDRDDEQEIEVVEFWGTEIPPGGKAYAVEIENEPPVFHMVHVTGCALGESPAKGPHLLKALYQGKPIVLATLQAGATHQFALDFGISSVTTFINTGASPVFISGYITRQVQHIEGSDDEEDEDEEEDSELEDSDAEAPRLVPLNGAAAVRVKGCCGGGCGFGDRESPDTRSAATCLHPLNGSMLASLLAQSSSPTMLQSLPFPTPQPPTQQPQKKKKKKRASPFLDDEAEETDDEGEDSDDEMEDDHTGSEDGSEDEEGSSEEDEDEDEDEEGECVRWGKGWGVGGCRCQAAEGSCVRWGGGA